MPSEVGGASAHIAAQDNVAASQHAPSDSERRGMQRRTSNATHLLVECMRLRTVQWAAELLRRVLSDDVRARSSNLARHDLGQGFAAKLFSACVRKLRRAHGR